MVRGDMSSRVAVSSTDSPPKKRNSTTWACVVERHQVHAASGTTRQAVEILHGHELVAATPLLGAAGPGVIHQNASHGAGGHTEEVGAILEAAAVVGQAHVGFVDQRRRLQGVIGPFPAHGRLGQPAQLVVEDVEEGRTRLLVAGRGALEQLGHRLTVASCHGF
jgi:hypothetical protein